MKNYWGIVGILILVGCIGQGLDWGDIQRQEIAEEEIEQQAEQQYYKEAPPPTEIYAPPTYIPQTPPNTPPPCLLDYQDGLPVISWQCADQYYNQEVIVEGIIVYTKNTGKACFLDFSFDWKNNFTAVIFASDFNKFPSNPEDYYRNLNVGVRGIVKEYQGKPEIILKYLHQIWVIRRGQ